MTDSQQAKGGLVTYEVEKIKDSVVGVRLVVTLDGKRLDLDGKHLEWEGDVELPLDSIEAQKDFNSDGIMDALIRRHCVGINCYAWQFVSIVGEKIVVAPITLSNFDKIVNEGGRFLVKTESDDATEYWSFDGKKAIKVRSIPHRKLETIAEIRWEGETQILEADIDLDGKLDNISCRPHARAYKFDNCTLPLPWGTTQDIIDLGCDRIGVLKTQSNGYRELVCNNNAVIRFDGKVWVQLKPAP